MSLIFSTVDAIVAQYDSFRGPFYVTICNETNLFKPLLNFRLFYLPELYSLDGYLK